MPASLFPLKSASQEKGKSKAINGDPFIEDNSHASPQDELAWSDPDDVEAHELKYVLSSPHSNTNPLNITCLEWLSRRAVNQALLLITGSSQHVHPLALRQPVAQMISKIMKSNNHHLLLARRTVSMGLSLKDMYISAQNCLFLIQHFSSLEHPPVGSPPRDIEDKEGPMDTKRPVLSGNGSFAAALWTKGINPSKAANLPIMEIKVPKDEKYFKDLHGHHVL